MNRHFDRHVSRRSFLRQGACAGLTLAGLKSQVFATQLMGAALNGQRFDDYKALVCVFQFGGNDNGNTLIPYDGGTQNHDFYAAARADLAIPIGDLGGTIIAPGNTAGRRFALHPELTDLKALFDQGDLAMIANVGTLMEPTTRQQLMDGTVALPRQLFAHDAQQEQWQFYAADAVDKVGWGGRVADVLQASGTNPDAAVSMNISIAGTNTFLAGRDVVPYAVGAWGPETLATWGLGSYNERIALRDAFSGMLDLQDAPSYSRRHALQKAYADITRRAIVNSELIDALLDNPSNITTPVPEDNNLARQFHMAARLIEFGRSVLNHERQIFLVSTGGYDNHDGLIGDGLHAERLGELNAAMKFFWDALGDIDQRDNVTTFTVSDFGRTYVSNGNGSDHGWGGHHFVMGGNQVAGGNLYGQFPDLTIEGPDDTERGRYIPTRAVEAYTFELANWLGIPLSEMSMVLPNLDRFLDVNDPSTHMGFMM